MEETLTKLKKKVGFKLAKQEKKFHCLMKYKIQNPKVKPGRKEHTISNGGSLSKFKTLQEFRRFFVLVCCGPDCSAVVVSTCHELTTPNDTNVNLY